MGLHSGYAVLPWDVAIQGEAQMTATICTILGVVVALGIGIWWIGSRFDPPRK